MIEKWKIELISLCSFFGRDRERDKNTRIILNNRCKVKDGKPDFNIEENIIEDNN